jgi:hypothetical protein
LAPGILSFSARKAPGLQFPPVKISFANPFHESVILRAEIVARNVRRLQPQQSAMHNRDDGSWSITLADQGFIHAPSKYIFPKIRKEIYGADILFALSYIARIVAISRLAGFGDSK